MGQTSCVGAARRRPRWLQVDDDLLLGMCSRQMIGYISVDPAGGWVAFDEVPTMIDSSSDLAEAKAHVWHAHQPSHATRCLAPGRRWWRWTGV